MAVGERFVVVQADRDLLAAQEREVDALDVREAAQRERGRAGQRAGVDRQRVDRALDDHHAFRALEPACVGGPRITGLVALGLRLDPAVERGIDVAHVDRDDARIARCAHDECGRGAAVADFAGGDLRARPRIEAERARGERRVDRGGGDAAAAEVVAHALALGHAAIGDVFDGRLLAALERRRPLGRETVCVVEIADGVGDGAAARVDHEIDAGSAGIGAVVAPAGAVLRVVRIDRQ